MPRTAEGRGGGGISSDRSYRAFELNFFIRIERKTAEAERDACERAAVRCHLDAAVKIYCARNNFVLRPTKNSARSVAASCALLT